MTEDEGQEERRTANRLAAFQCRQRRKIITENLEKTVYQISKDNIELRSEKQALKAEILILKKENENLRFQLTSEQAYRQYCLLTAFSGTFRPQQQSQHVFPPVA